MLISWGNPQLYSSFPFPLANLHPPVWIGRQIFTFVIILRSKEKSEFGVSLLLLLQLSKKLPPGAAPDLIKSVSVSCRVLYKSLTVLCNQNHQRCYLRNAFLSKRNMRRHAKMGKSLKGASAQDEELKTAQNSESAANGLY